MADEWDLFAIVRSCQSTTTTATNTNTTTTNPISSPQQHTTTSSSLAACPSSSTNTSVKEEEYDPFSFPNLLQPITNEFQELNELLTPFNPISNTSGVGINPNSPDFAGCIGQEHSIWPHQNLVPQASTSGFNTFHDQQQQNQASHGSSGPDTHPQTPKSRKRKGQQNKRVCHVTTDNLLADMWAWRKYGQKPIKGSPYPRNYYKCSSSKSCSARKQVERSNSDPNMFIITFTGDHNHPKPTHRNSLAGSTRNKASTVPVAQGSPSFQAAAAASAVASPPHSAAAAAASAAADLPENEEMEPDSPDPETETDVDAEVDIEPGLNLGPFRPSSSDIRFNPG